MLSYSHLILQEAMEKIPKLRLQSKRKVAIPFLLGTCSSGSKQHEATVELLDLLFALSVLRAIPRVSSPFCQPQIHFPETPTSVSGATIYQFDPPNTWESAWPPLLMPASDLSADLADSMTWLVLSSPHSSPTL